MDKVAEIRNAMEHGAMPMFLIGLVAEHKRNPEEIDAAISTAANEAFNPMSEARWRDTLAQVIDMEAGIAGRARRMLRPELQ